jgi:mannose/cellobiose epimerase-like protein (N-acyl-D-glucosamine 2-epimerase family)
MTAPHPRLPATPVPDFADAVVLRAHVADTMDFYHPRAIDPAGGFFHYFRDDGRVYDARHRHLVSSTRFVYDYAMAAREFPESALAPEFLAAAEHGLRYLRDAHRDPGSGAYAWTLRDGEPEDRARHAYGMAFVLLAYASARKAGIGGARFDTAAWMEETRDLLEARFWDADAGLYRDEADEHWRFSGYRGQNANMHLCEAHLAAFEASGEAHYLERALLLADHMTRRQAAKAGGLVWEHYDADWNVDWDYNRDNPRHLFRPWGFQPGHQTEWAKLLVILESHLAERGREERWLLPTARWPSPTT